jgi:hypothetical protein
MNMIPPGTLLRAGFGLINCAWTFPEPVTPSNVHNCGPSGKNKSFALDDREVVLVLACFPDVADPDGPKPKHRYDDGNKAVMLMFICRGMICYHRTRASTVLNSIVVSP